MEALTSGGVSLSEVLKHEEVQNLRARSAEGKSGNPDQPKVAPPPDMAMLGELAGFNEMRKK